MLRNGGTDADSQCSKMDRSGSRDTGWRRYRRIYIKDTTYIEAKLEQIKGARQSVTAVEKTTAKTQKIKNAEIVKETPLPESSCISDLHLQDRCRSFLPDVRSHLLQ